MKHGSDEPKGMIRLAELMFGRQIGLFAWGEWIGSGSFDEGAERSFVGLWKGSGLKGILFCTGMFQPFQRIPVGDGL